MTGPAPASAPTYQVHALRYGTLPTRTRGENFVGATDPGEPMPMDYFLWTVHGPDGVVVVDTGFSPQEGARRGRTTLAPIADLLAEVGVSPADVERVILTHLHYDHAGNLDLFPHAHFLVQEAEVVFATGPRMDHHFFGHGFVRDDIETLLLAEQQGRVELLAGDHTVAPGLELYHVGGHTAGSQIVRVRTGRGWLVLASDASHYSANRVQRSPFPIVANAEQMFDGFALCERLADDDALVIPGHDPAVAAMGSPVSGLVRLIA